ncbi:MAG: tetratricopeptide repeat protein, partial [Chloroflexota bacterium]|nr:tetratricopeptide repeat protein [Chloroflexota bacterium]
MRGAPVATPPNNLPRPLTSFVGREQDIATLVATLETTRLLTLAGVGGCGKTRLAREVAAAAGPRFPDGVWWIDLAPLADAGLVPQALASACGVAEQQGQSLLASCIATLAPTYALLILDNCEHLVETCAQIAQTLLSACPTLTLLTTSRETLNIDGETVYFTPTLAVPEESQRAIERIGQADAVRLFIERARAASSSFTFDEGTARTVALICRRVEGIPLAIELAAARLRVLALEEIARRLAVAIPLLAGGSRSAAPRHQTLRATLDWSYALLAPAEAALLQTLAVFAGGFTLDAAETVGVGDGSAPDETLDLLGRLVDKSLVTAREDQGAKRYDLLEIIRQYAQEKLDASGAASGARERHYAYFLRLAEQAEPALESADQLIWLNRLEREHDNIRAALRGALARGDAEATARMAAHLWRFWLARGYLSEGQSWLRQALHGLPGATHPRARALHGLSILTLHHEGYQVAVPLVAETLAIQRQLDDRRGLATAILNSGIVAHSHGDYARAVTFFEECLPLCWADGYQHGAALALSSMGLSVLHLGELARARALCEESVILGRAIGDSRSVAGSLTNLGMALLADGRVADAIARFDESLLIRRELGDRGGAAHTLLYLGRAALEQDDQTRASAYFQESFTLRDETGDEEGQAAALEGLAMVAAATGDGELAARRFGAAEAARERIDMPLPTLDRPLYDRWLAASRELSGADQFAAWWQAGAALAPQEAAAPPVSLATSATIPPPVLVERSPSHPPATAPARPASPAPDLRIFAFGEARVYLRGELIAPTAWTYAKARELLYFLLARGPASKAKIGLALWPDADLAQVRSQLHPALHHLRRALGAPEWVVFERGKYRFNRALSYAYDVEAFQSHLAQARRVRDDAPERAAQHLESATRIYRGDYLATGDGGAWSEAYRDELRRDWLEALALLGALRSAACDYQRAAEIWRALIAADPFQEGAHRELMRCLAAQGERALALRHFEALTRLLADDLAATPAPET